MDFPGNPRNSWVCRRISTIVLFSTAVFFGNAVILKSGKKIEGRVLSDDAGNDYEEGRKETKDRGLSDFYLEKLVKHGGIDA